MSETRTIHDPFFGKDVEISNRLVDRLRGRYAVGPTLPNGEPEFGWRQHDGLPPIQREAADEIERLREALKGAAVVTNTAADEIAKLRGRLEKRTAALEFIRDGYDNQDINHVDFRVGAYKAALDALYIIAPR